MELKRPRPAALVLNILLIALAAWAAFRFLLPWLAPFILAFGCAAALEPLVAMLSRRTGLPRGVCSAVCVLAFIALAACALWLIVDRLAYEARDLTAKLPEFFGAASETVSGWQAGLARYIDSAPEGVGNYIESAGASLVAGLESAPAYLSGKVLDRLGSFAAATPSALLFAVSFVIGVYFISASLPDILEFFRAQVPAHRRGKAARILADLRGTIGRWFKAQIIMIFIMFFALSAAFALLRIRYALLLALVTAVVDALPVLGAGTVLLPWAAYNILTGNTAVGVGLAVTYGAVSLLRGLIQAKLLGDQLGLHPLVTLVAIYVGYKAMGLWGMILFPIAAISAKQLNDSGVVQIWKKPRSEKACGV